MKEIVRVQLENEMDLILAHKRVMKLCEMTGFSLIQQTTIATAVSEIARCAIEFGTHACLILGVETSIGKKYLKAIVRDSVDFTTRCNEACSYAKRLVRDLEIEKSSREPQIVLKQPVSFPGTVTDLKLESFAAYFQTEPPISAYDELRRKNLLLNELAEKLRESENEYRVLTDTLPLLIFSANNRGQIDYVNKGISDFFGTTPKELVGISWQVLLHPQDYSVFSKDLNYAILKQLPFQGQYRFRQKTSGDFVWHMISILPSKNDRDIVVRWTGFLVDIHAQKLIETTIKDNQALRSMQDQLFQNQEELQRKVIELNRSNYELEQFAHLASHDLQEPLRKLLFYSDVLKKKYATTMEGSGLAMLNNMSVAADRMKELINDLLSYSQLQKQKLDFEEVDLTSIVREVVKDFDLQIKEKNAVVEIDPLPTVQGNILRLRQLFANLISNALKYSRSDVAPHITVRLSTNDSRATIHVKDNGIGFEDQFSEKIFGLFERLHTRDQFPGTGIGLSICKKIAELHNGTITATSKVNEYSEFSITLPVYQNEEILVTP